MEYTKELVKN